MKEIWTRKEATFHGDFVNFDRILSEPKPIQRPHPPVLMGGNGLTAEARVLDYADGWIPEPMGDITGRIARLQRRAESLGRKQIPVSVFGASTEHIVEYEKVGVVRCIHWLRTSTAEETEGAMTNLARVLRLEAEHSPVRETVVRAQ
jgi:alkanesulfonate monooxygenase SsuD/methylene tetrahydromethanopterin reductase-like flavin-dependent oxidoreductase (luciferase family)